MGVCERRREWDKEHFLQRLQPASLNTLTLGELGGPEWTDGGGGAMKGQKTWKEREEAMMARQEEVLPCSQVRKGEECPPADLDPLHPSVRLSVHICPPDLPQYLSPVIGQ